MKRSFVLTTATTLFASILFMQTIAQSVNGVYSLTGMHEMAGGFKFETDGHFQFFYSYGAVDRSAEGTFTVDGNKVILKSSKEPGKDFTRTKQAAGSNTFTIKVHAPNDYLASYVRCLVVNDGVQNEFMSDKNGMIQIDLPKAEKIYLQHQLFPDVVTQIKDEQNSNRYFEVTLNPSLEQVSFKGIDLAINGDTLTMLPNYFMPYENIRFVKRQ